MSITSSSSRRMLNASLSCPPAVMGMHLSMPSYRCRPMQRHSGSTMPFWPNSDGRPMRSLASPAALVTSSPERAS